MGTEILRPQDCLMRVGGGPSTSIVIPRSRKPSTNSYYYSNPNPKFYRKTDQRKQPQQQQHRFFPQSEKDTSTTTSVGRNGYRCSPPPTTKSVVKRDSTSSAAVVKNESTTVTILRRGESLDNINGKKKTENLRIKRSVSGDLSSGFSTSSGSESSDSERVVRSEVYAGNAFYLSPAPSSLPLPTFSIKKEGGGSIAIIDDSATKDLRRLLRLD